jgi:ribosomal protein S12 methylthiotransferase accessory factor
MAVKEAAPVLGAVSIEDMKRGVHEHLPFGKGDLEATAVLGALEEVGYEGLVSVELDQSSHEAHETIPGSLEFLLDHLPSD